MARASSGKAALRLEHVSVNRHVEHVLAHRRAPSIGRSPASSAAAGVVSTFVEDISRLDVPDWRSGVGIWGDGPNAQPHYSFGLRIVQHLRVKATVTLVRPPVTHWLEPDDVWVALMHRFGRLPDDVDGELRVLAWVLPSNT